MLTKTDADRFRKDVEECREEAAKAISELNEEMWLAAEWIKLAQSAEERHTDFNQQFSFCPRR